MIGAVDTRCRKIAAGAASESGTILGRLECPTAPAEGFSSAMRRTAEMLRVVSRQVGASYAGIGVACPGPLDPYAGIVGDVGTLPGWQGGNIVAELSGEVVVPVVVENDADAATLAEVNWGSAKGSGRFILGWLT